MTLFQTIATGAFGSLVVLTLVSVSRGRLATRAGLVWGAIWLLALLTVLNPGATKVLANVLGINRGVDVVLYTAMFVGLVGFFGVYMRFRRLERQITVLTRELALLEADSEGESGPSGSGESGSDGQKASQR